MIPTLRCEPVVVPDGYVAWWDGVGEYPTEFWARTEGQARRLATVAMECGASVALGQAADEEDGRFVLRRDNKR